MSFIEWTDLTWNPVVGCQRVSRECNNCYAMKEAWRFKKVIPIYAPTVKKTKGGIPIWTGQVVEASEDSRRFRKPMLTRRPSVFFVNSMSDLYYETRGDFIDKVYEVMMWKASRHIYQVLTKRPEMMDHYLRRHRPLRWLKPPTPNIWHGVSVGGDQWVARARTLLECPQIDLRFISTEPLIAPLDLRAHLHSKTMLSEATGERVRMSWVIVGGESGKAARPMNPDWARRVRDDCVAAGVPFFFKQWGEFDERGERVGKKRAGRLLDGEEWSQYPPELDAWRALTAEEDRRDG